MSTLIAFLASVVAAAPASDVRREGDVIRFTGQINAASTAAVKALVRDEGRGRVRRLVITSGGGESDAGLDLAQLVADRGLEVEVRDYCFSACASFVLVAGKRRIVGPGAVVGFHKTSSSFERVATLLQLSDIGAQVAARARREKALYARMKVSERLLYEPEIAIVPVCFAAAQVVEGGRARRQGMMASRFAFWVPTSAHLRSVGVEFEGDWPATTQDLSARVVRQAEQMPRRLTFTGAWDEAALDQAYRQIRTCPEDFFKNQDPAQES